MYVLWDVIGGPVFLWIRDRTVLTRLSADDTIARKVNSSDASAFADICGCFPSQGERAVLSRLFPGATR